MTDEAFPIEIGGEVLYLRFEDLDVKRLEQQTPVFLMFHPSRWTYENAARVLWRGLRRMDADGTLTHAIQQGPQGEEMAFRLVREFCGKFAGPVDGIGALFGSYQKAFIISGWFRDPSKTDAEPAPARQESGTPKN